MRPHRLEISAFGAFAGTVTVDFDDLARSGLFLLHGDTGAGKTTVLDALGFALYGRVPGERGAARRLRSDHAAPGDRTLVRLEATIGGRRLRVTRSPEQPRPKRRGEGMTTEPATVLLEERRGAGAPDAAAAPTTETRSSPTWTTISTRIGEADQEIGDRLGMTADQFFQVVLLPQGEFARFLHAPSDERVRLLERLFGTDRYRDVEAWFAERRRSTAATLAAHRTEIERRAALIADVAEVTVPDETPDRLWATDLACTQAAMVEAADRTVAARLADLERAQSEMTATEQLARRQQRRLEVEERRQALGAREPAMAALKAELVAATAAVPVESPIAAVTARSAEVAAAEAVAAAARAEVDTSEGAASAARLRARAQDCEQRLGQLADLQAVADALSAERAAAEQSTSSAEEIGAHLAAAVHQRDALTQARARDAQALEQAREARAVLPAVQRSADALADAAEIAAQLATATTDAARCREEHLQARERAQVLAEEHLRLRRDRMDAMVAELAARLSDGDPCPVCGSLDHPDKPVLQSGRVTAEQEDQAGEQAELARRQAEHAGEQAAAATTRLDQLASRLGPLAATGADELARRARTAHARRDEVAGLAATLEDLEARLAEHDRVIAALDRDCAAASEQREALLRDASAASARAQTAARTLTDRLDGAPDLATALAATATLAQACRHAADAVDALQRAQRAEEAARHDAERAARDAGFDDLDSAAAAARPASWRTEADQRLRAYDDERAGLHALLSDTDLQVPTMPPADLTGAAAALERARVEHQAAVQQRAEARSRVAALDRLVPALTEALSELPHLVAEAEQVRTLAEVLAGQGQNTRRMTLSAFVLAARLEEVAEVASARLLRMSQGRYTLVHTAIGRDGRRRAGLGLLARDTWTGIDRETATLSGGETFLASLALALGLADVVCAESGGARLESLFVDEGFGSLDAGTLDEVLDVLDGLREGGRMVGVVSHVGDLRHRIPAQLHVRKHEGGSQLAQTVA